MPSSFKEVNKITEEKEQTTSPKKEAAASKILASHSLKDKRISIRINSATYDKFALINSKLGTSNGGVVNMMISEYILKNKHLLDD